MAVEFIKLTNYKHYYYYYFNLLNFFNHFTIILYLLNSYIFMLINIFTINYYIKNLYLSFPVNKFTNCHIYPQANFSFRLYLIVIYFNYLLASQFKFYFSQNLNFFYLNHANILLNLSFFHLFLPWLATFFNLMQLFMFLNFLFLS